MHKWEIVRDVYQSIFKIENSERDTVYVMSIIINGVQ